MKNRILTLFFAFALTFSACGQAGPSQAPDEPSSTQQADPAGGPLSQTVAVNSREAVHVTPDIAEIVYSVSTEAADAASCQQQNSQEVDRVTALLKELGVAEGSIQTTDYYMNPRYDWSNDTRRLVGYEACTTLTVSDIPMERAGTILAESVNAGINNIQSISYLSSRYDEAYQEALAMAVQAAAVKARAMAEAAGYGLGDITYMQETSSYSQARYQDNALMSRKQATTEDYSVTIMPGELEVTASVMVEYRLQTQE